MAGTPNRASLHDFRLRRRGADRASDPFSRRAPQADWNHVFHSSGP